MQKEQGMKAIIYGCTGAVGSELVPMLMASPLWSKIHCIARKQPEEWANLPGKQKLEVEVSADLDQYFKQQNNHYKGYDTVFCCFGSRVKYGEETFVKVDKTYPLNAADIALRNNIPHYLLVSSTGSNPNSWFMYPRVKGQVERDLAQKHLNLLSITKPGAIMNRKGARSMEKISNYIPFLPKIQVKDLATSIKVLAEKQRQASRVSKQTVKILDNKDLLNLLTI